MNVLIIMKFINLAVLCIAPFFIFFSVQCGLIHNLTLQRPSLLSGPCY